MDQLNLADFDLEEDLSSSERVKLFGDLMEQTQNDIFALSHKINGSDPKAERSTLIQTFFSLRLQQSALSSLIVNSNLSIQEAVERQRELVLNDESNPEYEAYPNLDESAVRYAISLAVCRIDEAIFPEGRAIIKDLFQ